MSRIKDRALDMMGYGEYEPTREEMEGTKHDANKPRLDLLPAEALLEVAKVLTFGAKKYDSNNWRRGINFSRLIAASDRHSLQFRSDKESDLDTESGINHIAHKICNDIMLLQFILEGRTELDDRYKG